MVSHLERWISDKANKYAVRKSIAALLSFVGLAISGGATELVLFYEQGCPHCAQLEEFLASVAPHYPELEIRRYEIHDPEAKSLLPKLLAAYGAEVGSVPIVFIGDMAVVGGTFWGLGPEPVTLSGRAEEAMLLEAIQKNIAVDAPSPLAKISTAEQPRLKESLTLGAVVGAAALDSLNPCDFAVLVLLLGTLLLAGRRGKVLGAGLAFAVGIYLSYFVLGFLIYSVLGLTVSTRAFRDPFILAVSSLAILVGLWEMKDLLWYGKLPTIEVPKSWKHSLTRLTQAAVTIPGAFVAGVLDSLFLAPCTSGPYLVILTLLSQTTTRWQGTGYLLLYNLIFILPMIFITLGVHFGFTTTARAERWRTARLGKLHFATGLVMVCLGVGMIVGLQLGYL